MYKFVLVDPLLATWQEATQYRALPRQINEGLIKLIHKKGDKEVLGNWRPIAMLTCAYKIFAKAIAL